MEIENKVLDIQELSLRLRSLRNEGHTVVLCHGVFDLLHIGHVRYFRQAKKHGDILVVTLTPDRYVDKGPGRPAFPQDLRAEFIASLHMVDYVAVNDWPTAEETLRLLRPDIYAKGSEFKDVEADYTGKIGRELKIVNELGIRMVFTEDIVFSSSTLLNRYFPNLPPEVSGYINKFRRRWNHEFMVSLVIKIQRLCAMILIDCSVPAVGSADAREAKFAIQVAAGLVNRLGLIVSGEKYINMFEEICDQTPKVTLHIVEHPKRKQSSEKLNLNKSNLLEGFIEPFVSLYLTGFGLVKERIAQMVIERAQHISVLATQEQLRELGDNLSCDYLCLTSQDQKQDWIPMGHMQQLVVRFLGYQGCSYQQEQDHWGQTPSLVIKDKYDPAAEKIFFVASALALAAGAPVEPAVLIGLATANLALESDGTVTSSGLQKYLTSLLK